MKNYIKQSILIAIMLIGLINLSKSQSTSSTNCWSCKHVLSRGWRLPRLGGRSRPLISFQPPLILVRCSLLPYQASFLTFRLPSLQFIVTLIGLTLPLLIMLPAFLQQQGICTLQHLPLIQDSITFPMHLRVFIFFTQLSQIHLPSRSAHPMCRF